MERVYLYLYLRINQDSEDEIFALYCDLNRDQQLERYLRYKAGRYVNLTTVSDKLCYFYLVLNNSNLTEVLSSVLKLKLALSNADRDG